MKSFKWAFLVGCLAFFTFIAITSIYQDSIAQTFSAFNGQSPEPTVQDNSDVKEARGDRFHAAMIRAARQARRNGKITPLQLLKFRRNMLLPEFRKHVEEMAITQMSATGEVDKIPRMNGSIDWDKLADFLERMLPLILDFMDALLDIIGSISANTNGFGGPLCKLSRTNSEIPQFEQAVAA